MLRKVLLRGGSKKAVASKTKQEEALYFPPLFCQGGTCDITDEDKPNAMGNAPSNLSCATALESMKSGKLTTIASQEELQRYAATQELLSQAQSVEEASQVSRLTHTDSMDALAALEAGPPNANATDEASPRNNKRRSFRGRRRGTPKFFEKIGHALKDFETAMFPHRPQMGTSSFRHTPPTASVIPKVRGGVLLRGCTDDNEHRRVVRQSVTIMKELNGKEGLQAMGFEYRTVSVESISERIEGKYESKQQSEVPGLTETDEDASFMPPSSDSERSQEQSEVMSRLFHAESNILITTKNRKDFIADGDMYDQVARLCQEYAQEIMIEDGDLEWVSVCEAGNNPEPIRALVSTALTKNEDTMAKTPTLLIATGKGKVRAGVFSRQHLLTTGMECATAVPIVREAKKRGMNCILLDPNVHGDRLGMATFEKSMAHIFEKLESDEDTTSPDRPPLAQRDLFVLSHSQSGAQFARYLLNKSNLYVPHIKAIAFTDSTHNIQWTREKKDLHHLLQSDRSVYFKVSKESPKDALTPLETTGEVVDTDHFWEHRFGNVETRCAGTTEHSLTNWFARRQIWEHFDNFLKEKSSTKESVKVEPAVQ